MKEFLKRRFFGGKVPGWAIVVFVLAVGFMLWRKHKQSASGDANNPAANDTNAMPFSSPDMFPYAGQGLYSPPSAEGSVNPQTAPSPKLSAHQLHVLHEQHVQHVGNTPHRNTLSTSRLSPHQKHVLHEQHLAHIGAK